MQFFFDQLGFTRKGEKRVLMTGVQTENVNAVLRETISGQEIGVPVTKYPGETWGDIVWAADLSAVTASGCYRLQCEGEESEEIRIGDDPYRACFAALNDMFYYARCGCDLEAEKAGIFAHPACHTGPATVWGTEEQHEVSGGWHDAGDYGRYIVPGAKSAVDLMLAYEACPGVFGSMKLTEIREEILWELKWMLKMQRADGGVWHKVSCARFCPMIMPEEEKEPLFLSPVSTTATGDFCASMAMAAGFYGKTHPALSLQMKEAALRAWDFLEKHEPILFSNPEGISTGGYGDRSDADERFWAAAELAVLTGEARFVKAAAAYLENEEFHYGLGWGEMSGYALLACMKLDETKEKAETILKTRGREILARTERNAYGIALHDFMPWGSNMNISNDGVQLMLCAALEEGETKEKMIRAAARMLDYMLGCNPMGYSYVTGYGFRAAAHPHHRPSQARGQAVPGMLVGGPCGHRADAKMRELVPEGTPAGKCWVDEMPSYSGNEICIYWNSPLVWMMSLLYAAGELQ